MVLYRAFVFIGLFNHSCCRLWGVFVFVVCFCAFWGSVCLFCLVVVCFRLCRILLFCCWWFAFEVLLYVCSWVSSYCLGGAVLLLVRLFICLAYKSGLCAYVSCCCFRVCCLLYVFVSGFACLF